MEEDNSANCVSPDVVIVTDSNKDIVLPSAEPTLHPSVDLSKGTEKEQWQATLIALMAAQQQQIAELAKQTKIAMTASSGGSQPTPILPVVDEPMTHATTSNYATFKLTSYDPDNSAYAIHEWLEDATKLKDECSISDNLMIVKAGEALKNRGYRYCCEWRPIRRTWENFCADLITAFPDKETPGAKQAMTDRRNSKVVVSIVVAKDTNVIRVSKKHQPQFDRKFQNPQTKPSYL